MCKKCEEKSMCAPCKKKFVDGILEECATLFCNLGTDSSPEEIVYAYQREEELLQKIAEVDVEKSERLLAK